jgi:hypothetical protein
MANLTGIVRLLKKEQVRLTKELRGITAALAAFGHTYAKGTGTRKLSSAGRARIAAAQRARWAKARTSSAGSTQVVPIRKKRILSAAARKKIAAAQRARWAKVKASKKSA